MYEKEDVILKRLPQASFPSNIKTWNFLKANGPKFLRKQQLPKANEPKFHGETWFLKIFWAQIP
jgi:hypothetical protein